MRITVSSFRFVHPLLLSMLFFVLMYSCGFGADSPEDKLQDAEALIEQHPDSALQVLATVVNLEKLDEKDYNAYLLLSVKAKNKCGKEIKEDTLVFRVKDYYVNVGDMPKAGEASFYAGRIYKMRNDKENALRAYLDAEKFIQNSDNYNLKGLIQYYIGELNYDKMLKDESVPRLMHAAAYFNRAGNYKNEIMAFNRIGMNYHLRNELDSAFYFYDKGLAIATIHKDSIQRAFVIQNIGAGYEIKNEMDKARSYFRQALPYVEKNSDKAKVYANIARTFATSAGKDSLMYYTDKCFALVKNEPNPHLESGIYQLLSIAEEKGGNFEKSLDYHKRYTRCLNLSFRETNSKEVMEVEKRYNFQVMENDNNRLLLQRQSIAVFALVVLVGALIAWFVNYRKNARSKAERLEVEQKYYQLKDLLEGTKKANADIAHKKESDFRKVLLANFDIMKKTALLEAYMNDEDKKHGQKLMKRINEIVYGQETLDWNMIYETMSHLYDNFPEKIRAHFPQLEEADVKICCLTKAGLTNTEVAIITGFMLNTVQMKKSVIRKKLGIDGYGNLIEFLDNSIK